MKDSMKVFTEETDIYLEASLRNAVLRGDANRWVELRVKRGDDATDIAADLAIQWGQ